MENGHKLNIKTACGLNSFFRGAPGDSRQRSTEAFKSLKLNWRKIMQKCDICSANIDKSACDNKFSVISVVDDHNGKTDKSKKNYCKSCTTKIQLFISGEKAWIRQKEQEAAQ